MRDKNLDFIQFSKQVEEFIERKLKLPELLRTTVTASPTFPDGFYIKYPRKFKDLLGLTIIHWWLPDNLKWEIHLGLWSMSFSQFTSKQKIELNLMLDSKETVITYLYYTERYSSHEIFGNLLLYGFRTIKDLKILRENTKVERVQRKRGYSDKGSLRPEEKWLPDFDFTLTNLQIEKEKKQYLQLQTINRILRKLRSLSNK